jgi:hypothetical protein
VSFHPTEKEEEMIHRLSRFVAAPVALALSLAPLGCGSEEAMRFDPEPYRATIEKIEALVAKAEPEPNDGQALYRHAAELAGALGKNIDNHTFRETVMNRLISFGEQFSSSEEQGIPIDLAEARQMWKSTRDDIFRSADWYR